MNQNRTAGIALIAGSLGGLLTMILHPTGSDVVNNAATGAANTLNASVHLLAIISQPLVLSGALGLTVNLKDRRDFAFAGFVFFALASFAVIIAAAASGLVASSVVAGLAKATDAQRAAAMGALGYTSVLNQAFAKVYVALGGVALILWSLAMIKGREMGRALGVYGMVVGLLMVSIAIGGWVVLDIHGFGAVVIAVGAWFVWAAIGLIRSHGESAT